MTRRWILFASLLLGSSYALASGCAITITNMEVCRDKGKLGAVCANWFNPKRERRRVGLLEWNEKRFGMYCVSSKGMGNINSTIEKLCQGRECVENTKDLIKALE